MFKNFFFDYFYYRLYRLNSNNDFRSYPPVVVITGIQFLLFTGISGAIIRLFLDRDTTAPYAKSIASISIIFLVLMLIYNYKKYSNKFDEFDHKWINESKKQRRIKGFLITLTIVLAFVPSLIIGIFF